MRELADLRESAEAVLKTYWKGERGAFLEFLDEPYRAVFRGLFRPVPECYDPEVKGELEPLREFRSFSDLERAKQAVLQLDRIHRFLAHFSPSLFHRLNIEFHHEREIETSLLPLLGTAFGSFLLKGRPDLHPLKVNDVGNLISKGFEKRADRRFLKKEEQEKFLGLLFPESDQLLLAPLWGLVFQRIEEELGSVESNKGIDGRFVSCLYLGKKKAGAPVTVSSNREAH